jgi:hypothetical protein
VTRLVNSNFGPGRVRVSAGGPDPDLVVNPGAAALSVGDEVVPNYADAGRRHPPGVICEIRGGRARMQWASGGGPPWFEVRYLIKA